MPKECKEQLASAKADGKNGHKSFGDFDGCKMTFMVESTIYYNGKNEVYDNPLPINIFNFCYPKFDNYPLNLPEEGKRREITSALEEMMRINLLAIIYEAQKQSKPLPFIIPAPGSFFAQLKNQKDKDFYMALISDAINTSRWCAQDPVCNSSTSHDELRSPGSCHHCILVPETSCECFNSEIDRGLIHGSTDRKIKGLFS